MKNTLGGCLIVRDGKKFDYSTLAAVESLYELCDCVSIICFADTQHMDDLNELLELKNKLELNNRRSNIMIEVRDYMDWETVVQGRYRISYWQDQAKNKLNTDYYFCLQADEVIHENSFMAIRHAVQLGNEAYLIRRVNLWGSPYTYLNVPQNRLPVSDYCIRLAKLKYNSWDDGESIHAQAVEVLKDEMRMYHTGFVRKREVMNAKIINMWENVFQLGKHDPLCDKDAEENKGIFNPWTRYSKDDVAPIKEELPKYLTQWAKERVYEG